MLRRRASDGGSSSGLRLRLRRGLCRHRVAAKLKVRELRELLRPLHELRGTAQALVRRRFQLSRTVTHQLAGEVDEILVAARAGIVFGDGLSKAGGFLQ